MIELQAMKWKVEILQTCTYDFALKYLSDVF